MQFSPILSAASFAALMFVASAAIADPAGEWRVADGTATVRIRKCGAAYCGFVATTASTPGKDEKNPDPSKRGRSVIGIETLINMKPAGENLWTGTTYNAEDGQMYSAKMSMQGEKALKIEGCSPGGGMCGNELWSRVR
ncbi:MAG: DUF2147 domain-containing protein [Beijerinckiaceae bacterium]